MGEGEGWHFHFCFLKSQDPTRNFMRYFRCKLVLQLLLFEFEMCPLTTVPAGCMRRAARSRP